MYNFFYRRSSQQIYNVTLFFLFFMSLYGLLGVQFFGELTNHCVLNTTDPNYVTLNSLAIPDTFCSTDPESGYQCPEGMKCLKLELSKYIMGFNGFDEFGKYIFKSILKYSNLLWFCFKVYFIIKLRMHLKIWMNFYSFYFILSKFRLVTL